ncbi:unnamed protein product [Oncorhynchus mykiss]|uniref:Uncharacterized protein n=1 Tax=Oncorhynchus mykiss TaxID=8022 RepID=A0A060XF13_ONCMY|nr:unnamed protein product [Oncorhynchus mykiss]
MQPGSVCLKEGTGEKVLMEGEQTHKINTENSLWNLDTVWCCLSVRVVRCGGVQCRRERRRLM